VMTRNVITCRFGEKAQEAAVLLEISRMRG
jgi:hypothetical protein